MPPAIASTPGGCAHTGSSDQDGRGLILLMQEVDQQATISAPVM
jgi:hypothetical protein